MVKSKNRNLVCILPLLLFGLEATNDPAAQAQTIQAQTIEPTNAAPPPVSVVTQPAVITGTRMAPRQPGTIQPQDTQIVQTPMSNLPAPTGAIATGPPPPRCVVDPAIEEVRVTKVSREHVTIGFEIRNLGPGFWASDVAQQTAVFRFKSLRTGVEFRRNFEFQTNVPPGGVLASYTSAPMVDAIDEERGAQLSLTIFYTNNRSDNRRCNDDADMTNNRFTMDPSAFSEFMKRENGSVIGFARDK